MRHDDDLIEDPCDQALGDAEEDQALDHPRHTVDTARLVGLQLDALRSDRDLDRAGCVETPGGSRIRG